MHIVPTPTHLGGVPSSAGALAAIDDAPPSSVSGASAVAATPASATSVANLTPASLMAYCESRLNSLNTQMNTIFASQQSSTQTTQDINSIATALNDLTPASGNASPPMTQLTNQELAAINVQYQTAIDDAGGKSTPLGKELYTDMIALQQAKTSGDQIQTSAVSQFTQNLKNYTDDMNSNAQLGMINLQSLMSQQETAVQLTTNLVQSLGQQASDITKNIGQ